MKEALVFEIFKDVLKIKEAVDPSTLVYNKFQGWDSIVHMALVAALESKFDIMFEADEIINMSSFAEAVKIVEKHTT